MSLFTEKRITAAIAIAALTAMAPAAQAQNYPERTITLIVPFAAGGASDVSSRIMGESMSKTLGQTVVIENVAGAGGATGSVRGKNAKPDGYTIGFGHMGTHAAAKVTNPKLPYDPRTDFDYLGIHLVTPNIMIARKDFPATNLKEFIAYAMSKGPELRMAHNGAGSLSHLTCLRFFQIINVQPTYVTYRGYGQTINDIMASKVDGTCELIASTQGHVSSRAVKGFGVADDKRWPALPDIATAKEEGVPEFKIESWLGLYVPKGMPAAIMAKLSEAYEKALEDSEVQQKFLNIGGTVPRREKRGGAKMLEIIKSDIDLWADVVKKAGGIEAPPEEPAKK